MRARCIISAAFAALLLFAVPDARAQETYTVKQGDTLYRIATTHGMSVDELKVLNGLETNTIGIGQVLTVYLPEDAAPDTVVLRDTTLSVGRVRSYVVGEGETLYSIAADLGTKAYLLYALNEEVREPLEAGQTLVVPADPEGRSVYAVGQAAVFPATYAGRTMAGGAAYDPSAFVASHPELPMESVLLLENRAAGRATFATVADRGPVQEGLLIEISRAAADEIELGDGGTVHVWLVE